MNVFPPSWFPTGALAALALGCALPAHLSAGEAIQFSNTRNRQDPTAKSKLPGDNEGDRFGRVSPLDSIPLGPQNTRRDPIRSRKEKNAAIERANWIQLDRGQLDAQDEEKRASGMREASFEKESDRIDYFFNPLNEKDDMPGRPRSPFTRPSGRDRSEPGIADKETPGLGGKPEENSDARRTQVLGKDGQPLGEHTAKELDLKDLLSSGKANSLAPIGDKTALLWKEVLGGSGNSSDFGPGRRRDEATTADSFRGSVSSGSSGSARSGDSFAFRNDLNTRSAVPISPSFAESASRNFNLPTAPIAPRASDSGFGRSPGLYGSPAGNNTYGSPAAGAGADPSASYRSQPQRSSSGSLQIPQRPGYGGR